MSNLDDLINDAKQTIAMDTTANSTIRVLFSGGKDSMVVAHLAAQGERFNGVGHVRTLTGPASIKHSADVIKLAEDAGWDCLVAEPFTRLHMLAAAGGLPGPALHSFFYSYLKERPIRQLTKMARKADKAKRVIWLTGIRKAESAARDKIGETRQVVSGNEWWINPILDWEDRHIREYVDRFKLTVPRWHHSIDCFCGAYADPVERAMVMSTLKDQAKYTRLVELIARAGREIQKLEVEYGVRKPGDVVPQEFCVWGHGLSKSTLAEQRAQPTITICNKCGVGDEVLRQKPTEATS